MNALVKNLQATDLDFKVHPIDTETQKVVQELTDGAVVSEAHMNKDLGITVVPTGADADTVEDYTNIDALADDIANVNTDAGNITPGAPQSGENNNGGGSNNGVENKLDGQRFDFEDYASGTKFTQELQKEMTGSGSHFSRSTGTTITDAESVGGGKSLAVQLPKDKAVDGLITAFTIEEQDEYFLSYNVKFGEDFAFNGSDAGHTGGKLPGLASDTVPSGGAQPDGTNGFSARMSWGPGGATELYLYDMHKKTPTWGAELYLMDEHGEPIRYKHNEWNTITQRVKMNDAGQKNGEIDIWINGQKAIIRRFDKDVASSDYTDYDTLTGLEFQTDGSKIDKLAMDVFVGGDEKFLSGKGGTIYLDNITTTTDPSDIGIASYGNGKYDYVNEAAFAGDSISTLGAEVPMDNTEEMMQNNLSMENAAPAAAEVDLMADQQMVQDMMANDMAPDYMTLG